MNLYPVTKFLLYGKSFTVHYFYTKISSFMPFLSIRIVLSCFSILTIILNMNLKFAVCHTLDCKSPF